MNEGSVIQAEERVHIDTQRSVVKVSMIKRNNEIIFQDKSHREEVDEMPEIVLVKNNNSMAKAYRSIADRSKYAKSINYQTKVLGV